MCGICFLELHSIYFRLFSNTSNLDEFPFEVVHNKVCKRTFLDNDNQVKTCLYQFSEVLNEYVKNISYHSGK